MNTPAAIQRRISRVSPQADRTQARPRIAQSGHIRSPRATPTASGHAPRIPPESARAVSATQTGPGTAHSPAMAAA